MSTTDKGTATCLLQEYLKKRYGQDVIDYIGYKGDVGKVRLTALISNSLPKKELLSDEDIDVARMRVERHLNEKVGIPLTNPTGNKLEAYPWQKTRSIRGVCNIEPENIVNKKLVPEIDKKQESTIGKHPGISPLPSHSSYTAKLKEKKKLPAWLIAKFNEDKDAKRKPVKYSYNPQSAKEIICKSCGARMSATQIVCTKCGSMR